MHSRKINRQLSFNIPRSKITLLFILYALSFTDVAIGIAKAPQTPTRLENQVIIGEKLYRQHCLVCHGERLYDGSAAQLVGDIFYAKWQGRTHDNLLQYLKKNMPPGSPGELANTEYHSLAAYIFYVNGFISDKPPIDKNSRAQAKIMQQKPTTLIPPDPRFLSRSKNHSLKNLKPVTNAVLTNAIPDDWLMWRRTYNAFGYSPLTEINTQNIGKLNIAWAWTMPAGRNIATPLVLDGVLFMHGNGNRVFAFNAQTGDILWRYQKEGLEAAKRPFGPRAIAIYQDRIITTTDDGYVVALNVKTGVPFWEKSILSGSLFFSGGPLIADGKILLGTSSASALGKNFIVSLDAISGKEQWRFYTVQGVDEGTMDSWNGASHAERQGAGIWVPGSYDSDSGLVFFGTGNTYRPQLLIADRKSHSNNDALYTNSTIALDIDTGNLAWYFQHLPNDQWNYDWAFERMLMTLTLEDKDKRVVVTAGKQAIFEGLNIEDGEYLFSFETGFQNVITAIDKQSGSKTIDSRLLPTNGKTVIACPDSLGVRNWQPMAFNPNEKLLFTPFRESCMEISRPIVAGATPHGEFGQLPIPVPNSDGNFGGIRAINMHDQKLIWETRQRAEVSTGVLATNGGMIFFGSRDRFFSAHDQTNGKLLWRVRLNGVPSGGPISFTAVGKQYIAVSTGDSLGFSDYHFGVGVQNPENDAATIWVFEIP